MIRKLAYCFCLVLALVPLGVQAEEEEKKEEVRPILEEWRETLKFGIAEEVIDALKKIREAEETSLNPELVKLFGETLNNSLKIDILTYFGELEYAALEGEAARLLVEYEELPGNLVSRLVKYLATIGSRELAELAPELLDSSEDAIAIATIQALGEMEAGAPVELLLERFADDQYANERKPEIILALGKLQAAAAVSQLIEIVEDRGEERIWRMYAADALGKIGDEAAVPVLKNLFGEDDALLRSYAASALAGFRLPETTGMLIQGLKDSNWKVRIQAAKGLANREATGAVEILKYKVGKDPVKNVQLEAMRTLGAIGTRECFDFLREIYRDEDQAFEFRDTALITLIEHDLEASVATFIAVVTPDLDKKMGDSKIAEATAKRLSVVKSAKLKELFALFLGSENMLLRIYGIRGVVLNKISSLKAEIRQMAENDTTDNVKKEALSALEKF